MRAPENFFSTLFKMRISQHGRRVATAEAKAKQSQTPAAGTVARVACGELETEARLSQVTLRV